MTRNSDRFWTSSGAPYISTSNAFAAAFACTPSCSNGGHDIRFPRQIYHSAKCLGRTNLRKHDGNSQRDDRNAPNKARSQ
jgi:hypothetical protein